MKKAISFALAILTCLSMTACGASGGTAPAEGQSGEAAVENDTAQNAEEGGNEETGTGGELQGTTLEVAVTYTGETAEEFKAIMKEFEQQYGCTVNVAEYGADYEATLKTRMAANELPDVFMTHGWSVLRYKEYLMELSDQPWVADYDESALGVIKDEDGSLYVLMLGEGINGIVVNKGVCDKAGVDPYAIHTWDDFTEACAKVKESGSTPISVLSNPGLLANIAGTFVSYEGELAQDSTAMLDGTWDWNSYGALLDAYAEWIEKGYFYEDMMTMNDADQTERFASGDGAFILGNGPEIMMSCEKLNPDAEIIFLPVFASKEGGKELVGIGEGSAFGVWKDTKNEAASKKLLEFLSQPETALRLNKKTGEVSSLKSLIEIDDGYGITAFQKMKENCADCNLLYDNLWDRKYMPSGMWPIFGTASNMLFDDSSEDGRAQVLAYLRENYQSLYEAAMDE